MDKRNHVAGHNKSTMPHLASKHRYQGIATLKNRWALRVRSHVPVDSVQTFRIGFVKQFFDNQRLKTLFTAPQYHQYDDLEFA